MNFNDLLGRLLLVARIFGDVIKFCAKSSELSLLKTSHKNYASASRLFTCFIERQTVIRQSIERLTERLKRSAFNWFYNLFYTADRNLN